MCAMTGQLVMVFIVTPLALTACGAAVFVWALNALRKRQEERVGRVWKGGGGFEGEESGV